MIDEPDLGRPIGPRPTPVPTHPILGPGSPFRLAFGCRAASCGLCNFIHIPAHHRNQSLAFSTVVPHSPLLPVSEPTPGDSDTIPPFMQGLKRLQEAIERHRENRDINIKYKTPLTGKSARQGFSSPFSAFERLTLSCSPQRQHVHRRASYRRCL